MAAACGESINIPIITRSLAKDFYQSAARGNYSIPLDRSFLLVLDAGIQTASGPSIDKFQLDWWNRGEDMKSSVVLNSTNLDHCLKFHKEQLTKASATAAVNASDGRFSKPHYIWKPDALQTISVNDSCSRCRLYRAVALGTHDEQCDIRNHITASEVSLSAQKSLVMRRASGFNQLFEYLTIKELDADAVDANAVDANAVDAVDVDAVDANAGAVTALTSNSPSPQLSTNPSDLPTLNLRSNKGKKQARRRDLAETVRRVAVAEVNRLQNIPRLKWTWGINMELSELGNLHRSADNGCKIPHSDYDSSLPGGSDTRSESEILKIVSEDEEYCTDLGDDIQSVPDLHPHHFPHYPQRLNKKRSQYLKSLYDDPVQQKDEVLPLPEVPSYVVLPPLPLPKLLPIPLAIPRNEESVKEIQGM